MICHFNPPNRKKAYLVLQIGALVILKPQFLQQAFLDLPELVFALVGLDSALHICGAIWIELDAYHFVLTLILFPYVFEKFFHIFLLLY